MQMHNNKQLSKFRIKYVTAQANASKAIAKIAQYPNTIANTHSTKTTIEMCIAQVTPPWSQHMAKVS